MQVLQSLKQSERKELTPVTLRQKAATQVASPKLELHPHTKIREKNMSGQTKKRQAKGAKIAAVSHTFTDFLLIIAASPPERLVTRKTWKLPQYSVCRKMSSAEKVAKGDKNATKVSKK